MGGMVKNNQSRASMDLKFLELELDLSNWEFVSSSDLDRDDDGGVESWSSGCSIDDGDEDCGAEKLGTAKCSDRGESKKQQEACEDAAAEEDVVSDECEVEGSEDEEEDVDDDDLDDELVPHSVTAIFGRQRMRKLGSRNFAKMTKSKRASLLYSRPGCVHGKHGLGLKYIV